MIFEDDETLRMYVEESLEHLSDIENSLLSIEETGENIDEELVNQVFRAAHSIKGGAGFMGLSNIKDLSHKIENILGMVRNREMIPTPEIVTTLLKGFDTLRDLINNVENSNDIDVSAQIQALVNLTTDSLPEDEKDSVSSMVSISLPDKPDIFEISQFDVDQAKKSGKIIYLVEYDLIQDIQAKGKTPLDVVSMLLNSGIIMHSKIDIEAIGTLDSDIPTRIPFYILFASIIEPEIISTLFDVEEKYVHSVTDDMFSVSSGVVPSGEAIPIPDEPKEIVADEPAPTISEEPERIETPEPVSDLEYIEEENISPQSIDSDELTAYPEISESEFTPEIGAESVSGSMQTPESSQSGSSPAQSAQVQTSLRVNVSLLDSLMTLAGELVLSRNQLMQGISANSMRALEIAGQRIDMVTSELQEAIMRTRMQSISNVFNKFPRVVRDLSRELGKEIDFSIEGKEVELDKTIIEAISDPLTHLVRNSVDHGIEPPEVRRKMRKDPTGKIMLKAFHEAGQVNIEISDDGKGIDGEKLAVSAMNKGLLAEQQASMMSEKEKTALIFLPGFSTAEKVTDVSGRGVGMDVVKTNLDKLGGIVDIDSKVGEGTVIRIKLPLTLAIIPSQIISAGNERYAIPQVNLDELLRIPAHQVRDRIEKVGDADVVRLRGNLLPLLELSDVLGIEKTFMDTQLGEKQHERRDALSDRRSTKSPLFDEESSESTSDQESAGFGHTDFQSEEKSEEKRSVEDRRYHADSAINIAVVSAGTFKYGLVVDVLRDSEEIVVKPLGRHLKRCKGYAGATIMGDGKVALILDVAGLAQMAELTSLEGTDRVGKMAKEKQEIVAKETNKDVTSLLLFRNTEEEQFAVPLRLVERIERVNKTDIEEVGGKKVIQYRNGSLPLYELSQVAQVKELPDRRQLEVILFILGGREVGLMVTPPVDAVEVDLNVDAKTLRQPGIMGSAIINNHTTLMVDMFEIIKTLNPEWFENDEHSKMSTDQDISVLFAEDSDFFRNQVKGFLEDDGYKVFAVEDGLVAWNRLEEYAEEIDIVLTDLEMPNMDGFQLTQKIKADDRFSHLPVIALTSLASDEDIARGEKIGMADYQIKLDREKLLESVRHHISMLVSS